MSKKFNYFIKSLCLCFSDNKKTLLLTKITKLSLTISMTYIYFLMFAIFIICMLKYGLNYTLFDFVVFGIPWTLIWIIWDYFIITGLYWMPAYYFIVCFYVKLRLRSVYKKLNKMIVRKKSIPIVLKYFKAFNIIKEHNEICVTINNYNKFWRKYLSITSIIFILLICFLSYVVFIAPNKWYLHLEFAVVLSAHILTVLNISYSASSVSYYNRILYENLHSLIANSNFPTVMKLRVR